MSAYIHCPSCGCDSLDVDTLHCSCDGAETLENCVASERFARELGALKDALADEQGAAVLNRAALQNALKREAALRDALRSVAILDQDDRPLDTLRPASASGFDWRRRSLAQEQIARKALEA